jgi:D-alanyl-D-alanine carboxypeptidase
MGMNAIRKFMVLICWVGVLNTSAYTQGAFNKAKMDSLLDIYDQKHQLMLTMALAQDNQVIYKRAIGYSWVRENLQVPTDVNTKFRIGSITKTFTAVMILQLMEEKKLKLNTPLSKYFPKFPNAQTITIEHLLQHRSGIHNFTNDSAFVTYMYKPQTREGLMNILMELPSDFEPGTQHSYSNSNYVLLGMIVEKVRKKEYAEVLKEKISDPLGLENTYCGTQAEQSKNEARSYIYNGKVWVEEGETDMSIPLGAGMVVSTPTDLIHFMEGIFSYQLLRKETVDQMIIQRDGYGMGVFTIPFYEHTGIGHNGRLDGFQSVVSYFPADKFSVAVSANGLNADLNDFLIGVLSVYFNKPYALPKFYTFDVSESILTEYAGTYHCAMLQLDFYVSKEGNLITGQAAGQSSFLLDAISEKEFVYKPAGLEMVFNRNMSNQVDQFVLKQSGMEFIFVKLK